jgi:hypothetical protein
MATNAQAGPSRPSAAHTAASLPQTSMTNILLEPLNTLQQLSVHLFHSLSPPQNRPPPPPLISDFVDCDATLAAALQLARAHQARQRRIEVLKDEVLALEARWRDVVESLEAGRRELEVMLDEGEERTAAIRAATDGAHVAPTLDTTYSSPSRPSRGTLYGSACVRATHRIVLRRAAGYARARARPAAAAALLPAVPERGEDAARRDEPRATARPPRRDALRRR